MQNKLLTYLYVNFLVKKSSLHHYPIYTLINFCATNHVNPLTTSYLSRKSFSKKLGAAQNSPSRWIKQPNNTKTVPEAQIENVIQPDNNLPKIESSPKSGRIWANGSKQVVGNLEEYINDVNKILQNKEKEVSFSDLEEYLNRTIRFLVQYRNFSLKEKVDLRNRVLSVLESEYKLLNENLGKIKQKKYEEPGITLLNVIFKYLSFCMSQNLHNQKLYDLVIKPLLFPGTIFQFHSTKRFQLILLYMQLYEKNYLNNPSYINLANHFKLPKNFEQFCAKASKEDFLSMIDAVSFDEKGDKDLKSLLCQAALNKVQENFFDKEDILKLFTFICRGQMLPHNSPYLVALQPKLLSLDLTEVDKTVIAKMAMNIKNIRLYSKGIYARLMNFLMMNPDLLREEIMISLLRGIEGVGISQALTTFLNSYMKESYLEKGFSINLLTLFIYQLAKVKALDLELFETLEKYISENIDKGTWRFEEIYGLLSSCTNLCFDDSPLFAKLESRTHDQLKGSHLVFGEFSGLVSVISHGLHLYNFKLFETILIKSQKYLRTVMDSDVESFSSLLYSLAMMTVKYKSRGWENYSKNNRKIITQHLKDIIALVLPWLNLQKIKELEPKFQVRIFQFILTLKLEFPTLFLDIPSGSDIFNYFETDLDFIGKTKSSNLSIDIEAALKASKIEYSPEYRVYVYFVDAFIKPNIAVQFEGVRHYTRRGVFERSQDLLRDFHLTELGYRIVKVPYFEFSKMFFSEMEKKEEYLRKIIFETNEPKH